MIKNRELALIPDSALELLELPATAPEPRTSTTRSTPARTKRGPGVARRTTRRPERSTQP
jgi:hypothetical protein